MQAALLEIVDIGDADDNCNIDNNIDEIVDPTVPTTDLEAELGLSGRGDGIRGRRTSRVSDKIGDRKHHDNNDDGDWDNDDDDDGDYDNNKVGIEENKHDVEDDEENEDKNKD